MFFEGDFRCNISYVIWKLIPELSTTTQYSVFFSGCGKKCRKCVSLSGVVGLYVLISCEVIVEICWWVVVNLVMHTDCCLELVNVRE